MKKLFLLLALLGMVATGCSMYEGGNIPDDAYISLNKEIVTISPDGESVGVKVYSNYAWELTNNCDWITTSITSGDAIDTGVIVTLTADLTYDDREGTIVFSCGNAKKLLVVSQKFKEAIISDANNTFNIPVEGGVAILNYQTSVDCEVIIPEEAQDWINIEPATRGLISKSSTLYVAENTTYSARTAVIKVVAKDNAEIFVKYTINQEQKDGVLVYGDNTFNVDGVGGSVVIKYQANVDCDVIIPDDAQSWISLATSTRGLSTYSTRLNIAENNSGEERSCVVKVTSQGDNELFAEYTIVQKPTYCLYYTSYDGNIVQPYSSSVFGATIISNTYMDGVGAIEFKTPITAIGDYAFAYCDSLTSVTIPNSVTTIGRYAFVECSSLTSVTIGDSVTTIGDYAFYHCSNLTSVYISDIAAWYNISFGTSYSNPLYYARNLYLNNELVTDLTIPDSVTTIGNSAFYNCDSLTSVTIPNSVTMIGYDAFYGCSNLQEFKGKFASEDGRCLIVDGTLISFAPAGLTEYTIPDSVTTIGDGAFAECRSLTSATIPDSVTTIGDGAFAECCSLTSVTIPDSVTTIGNYAFGECNSLTSVTIGDSVTTIGGWVFYNCSSLTSVYISDIAAWCNISFDDSYSNPLSNGCNLYLNNALVTDLTIPDSVTTIGGYAFSGCTSLTSVTIPDSVTTIGEDAFRNCSSLTSVTIPDSVTTIGDFAFYYCSSLTSVYCKATTPPSLGEKVFKYYYDSGLYYKIGCDIYVPTESVKAYKSAEGWKEYADDIVGYTF